MDPKDHQDSLLTFASQHDSLDKIKGLIAAGANINTRDSHNFTPLMKAAEKGFSTYVEFMLEVPKVAFDASNAWGYTALLLASIYGHLDILKLLVTVNADVNYQNMYDETSLMLASKHGHYDIVEFLVDETNIDLYAKNDRGQNALDIAKEEGWPKIVEFLEARMSY
jgi:ankyrin repeat protein